MDCGAPLPIQCVLVWEIGEYFILFVMFIITAYRNVCAIVSDINMNLLWLNMIKAGAKF